MLNFFWQQTLFSAAECNGMTTCLSSLRKRLCWLHSALVQVKFSRCYFNQDLRVKRKSYSLGGCFAQIVLVQNATPMRQLKMRVGKLSKPNRIATQLLGEVGVGLKCTVCTRHPSLISIFHLENSCFLHVCDRDTSLLGFIYVKKKPQTV